MEATFESVISENSIDEEKNNEASRIIESAKKAYVKRANSGTFLQTVPAGASLTLTTTTTAIESEYVISIINETLTTSTRTARVTSMPAIHRITYMT